jgi:hypothetical protein
VTLAELRTDLVILACAIAAGIYGSLAAHPTGTGAGIGFVLAAGLLAGLALALTLRPPAPINGKEATMSKTRAVRPIPIALTALVALFSALAALAVSNGVAGAHGTTMHHGMHMTAASSSSAHKPRAAAFRADMRKLWEDHITWTRLAIISLEGDTPDTEATVGRLLRNQDDIGDAVKPFYGEAAGEALSQELRQHILIAADVIAAAKAGDSAALADAQARWLANADGIAALLHGVNPRNWPLAALEDEMHTHLDLTTQEAVAHLQGNWTEDVATYDRVHLHILHMSDLLADGIVAQFPGRFR